MKVLRSILLRTLFLYSRFGIQDEFIPYLQQIVLVSGATLCKQFRR
jgi:hypothetical protein